MSFIPIHQIFSSKKYFLLSLFTAIFILFSNQIHAAGDCSPFIGQAALNEFFKDQANQSNDPDDFVEVKILNGAIGSPVYETWTINICENSAAGQNNADGCSGPILLSNFNDTSKPWLVLKGPASGAFINIQGGFDATLVDSNGDLIDYLSVSNFSQALTEPNPDITCNLSNLVFDYQFISPGNSIKTIYRVPDGTGDWDGANAASAPATEDTTNDVLPNPPANESYPFVTLNDISLNTASSGFFTVSLVDSDGNPTTFSQTVTVSYYSQDGTATVADSDYTSISLSTVAITAGQSSITIPIDASSSDSNDVGEYFYIVLNAVENSALNGNSPNAYILKHFGTATLGGPLAEWNFDVCNISNPDDITDSSGNNHHATPHNGVTTSTGRICTAGSFDGNDDYVSIPSLPNLTSSFTISAWINPNDIDNDQRIFVDDESNSGGFAFSLGDAGDGRLRFFSRNVSPVSLDTSAVISSGTWYHVVAVHDSINKTRQMFVNGADVTGGAQTYTGTWGSDNGDASIGGETDGAGSEANSNWRFNGLIDEVKIYNRALSAAEINNYYANPDPLGRTCVTCIAPISQTIVLSTQDGESLPGIGNFNDEDIVEYDPATSSASIYSTLNNFLPTSTDINALHIHTDGRIIFSTTNDFTIGLDTFQDDDLIAYDPSDNSFTLYFNGADHFNNNEDIDAVHVLDAENLYLSTTGNARLGSGPNRLDFEDGDLILYNTTSKIPTYVFGESDNPDIFSGGADIDGVHFIDSDNFLLSTDSSETITTPTSGTFEDGDIFLFHPISNTVDQAPYFDEGNISNGAGSDIDALTLPPLKTIHHIEFEHDGAALTCNAESITVKACQDNSIPCTLATSAVSLDLTPTGWVEGENQSITGSANLSLKQTTADITVTLSAENISPTPTSSTIICRNAAGTDIGCSLTFSDSGFIFNNVTDGNTIIPTQLSGKSSNIGYNAKTINLQAVKKSNTSTLCVPAFQNQDITVEFAAECSNPNTCVAGQDFNFTTINSSGTPTPADLTETNADNAGVGSTGYNSRLVKFDNEGKSIIEFNYPEAGSIELHARHNVLLADGITPSGNYMSGSSSFVVRPFAFALSGLSYATTANGSVLTQAGEDFVTTFTAVRWKTNDDADNDGIANSGEDLSTNITTTNFGKENVTPLVPLNITTSVPTVTLVTSAGILTNSANSAGFTNGVGTKTYNWNEVGIFNLTTTLSNYLASGENIIGSAQNVGRFIPHHFETDVTDACNNFTYSSQPFIATVYARNKGNTTTVNYRDTFAHGVTLTDANPAATPTGTFANNTITTTSFSSNTPNNGSNYGVGSTEVANNFTYTFTTKETVPDSIDIRATDSNDTTISSNGYTEDSTEIRGGRTRLENSYGSELVDMAITAQAEYYTANGFEINSDDTCSIVTSTLSDIGTDTITIGDGSGATQTCIIDDDAESGSDNCSDATVLPGPVASQFESPAIAGNFNFFLKAPGVNNTGDIGITLTSPIWLKYDWDGDGANDDDPTGVASFGLYRGDDRVIYWREIFD